jgi:hypothetical protein
MSFFDKKVENLNKLGDDRLLTESGTSEER